MFSRGRTAFMKTHDPAVLGFGGELAYIESTGRSGYAITVLDADGAAIALAEDTAARKQTPSYWRATFTNTAAELSVVQTKYITESNVAVTQLELGNTGSRAREVTLVAKSPYASTAEGAELVGVVSAFNRLTTIRPRFSGDRFTPGSGVLRSTRAIPAGGKVRTKVQLGLVTEEITSARHDAVRASTPAVASEWQMLTGAHRPGVLRHHRHIRRARRRPGHRQDSDRNRDGQREVTADSKEARK